MITSDDVESSWALLENSISDPRDLRVREVDKLNLPLGRPLFAVDADQHRHLLIPILPSPKIREDKQSAGVHIVMHRLLDNNQPKLFIDVICRKPHLNKLFSIITSEMLNLLAEDSSRPHLTCQQVLNRWRELLEKEPSMLPDMQTLTGLFGELWQLRRLVGINPESVNFWFGPIGGRP
jgi:hypothetical protein